MTGLMLRLKASTREEAERRRFGIWSLVALVVLLPLWWMWGADLVTTVLRIPMEWTFRLFGLAGETRPGEAGGWMVATGLTEQSGKSMWLALKAEELRRFLLSFPFFFALMAAPPRAARPWTAMLIGSAALTALFMISVPLYVWGTLAPLLNPGLSPDPSGAAQLVDGPLHPLLAQIVLIGRYIGITIAPFFAAMVLWATLNPEGRTALMGDIST